MRTLITGGCGFIGSSIAVSLSEDGSSVTCFDNLSRRGSGLILNRVLDHGCSFIHGDIRAKENFSKLEGEFDIMIECSAEPSVLVGTRGNDVPYIVNTNLVGSVNCFEFCRERGMPVLFLSTSRVYPYDAISWLQYLETGARFELWELIRGMTCPGVGEEFTVEGKRTFCGAMKLA